MKRTSPAPLALTMGDPAGIGGELSLKAWLERKDHHSFFVLDDPDHLRSLAKKLGLNIPVEEIATAEEARSCCPRALPVLPVRLSAPVNKGQGDSRNAEATLLSIQKAVSLVQSGEASAVVTNPINKAVLYSAGFSHPGHTEYLAELARSPSPSVMMLASPDLRVVPITIHVSLQDAVKQLDEQLIRHTLQVTHEALQKDFGIKAPRIAVAGLNPHAGENGSMGTEEQEMIAPLLDRLRAEGLNLSGPLPADTMFHHRARQNYDAAVCMYHDQALIPIKTLAFDEGVNVTLGLPFIRTSPDHGTAYDIADRGIANPSSFIASMDMAWQMATAQLNSGNSQ
ncbi:4-hydroxythreonine-4-phosphate dehydrogenase PdxA [Kiloniella sp. b19]|uniref:4-hydroxythreonine-4-phosphate dehydrogenase PdxA n=1 Tax=Kiloniella sp. GXU_MW_B19 TaxID=3141326 RepID=UPI0031D7A3A9